MCGVVGYFGFANVDLARAAGAILHRGPDMQGISSGKGWRVAFNRLSILDVSEKGMQPFTYDSVTVFMNGEIYNYLELIEEHKAEFSCHSGSDVEIVPYLFRKYGIDFLHKLNGMFALIIIDEKSGRHYLVRDRYGKKPIFYKQEGACLYFASELKALRQLINVAPDKTNLALNMACWLLVQPLTPYQGVFNVNPGHYLEFSGNNVVERQWYAPAIVCREASYDEIRESFLSRYRRSIQLRLRSDVPVGIALSGGLDSSSMAYLANNISPHNFLAFTANITGKENLEGITDVENPRRLCRDMGIRQIPTMVNYEFWDRNIVDITRNYDEILLNSGTLVFYALAEAAKLNGVKVMLSGVGGDELFGGYPWQSRMRSLPVSYLRRAMGRKSSAFSKSMHGFLSGLGSGRIPARLARDYRLLSEFQVWHAQTLSGAFLPYMRDMDRQIAERIESVSEDYFRIAGEAVDADVYNQIHYANIFTVIGNQNYQVDMACMRHSVENRSPLLDFELFEYMMAVPDRAKNVGGPKSLMRDMLSTFLPPYITSAKKSGPTMPLDMWFKEDNREQVAKAFLAGNRELIAEYLSPQLAGSLDDHAIFAGRPGVMRLFALLSFVIWAKINIENSISDQSLTFNELALQAQ